MKKEKEQAGKAAGYIYMVRCKDGSLYTGIATDPLRRFQEHKEGKKEAAKYTKSHPVEKGEAVFETADIRAAARYEYRIKQLTRQKKEMLIKEPALLSVFFPELQKEAPAKDVSADYLPYMK